MRQFVKVLVLVISVCMAVGAFAKPPICDDTNFPPGKTKSKPTKVTILHCGCSDDGGPMLYVDITVSSKSKGHLHHEAGSMASCSDGADSYIDFVRNGSDCQVDDGSDPIDGLEFCSGEGQAALAECGIPVL